MEIDLLGRFAVRRDGETLDPAEFGGRRVRELVRVLAAERGRVVSRDALIEALWGDHPPADPGTNLNVVVNRARRALGEPGLIETAGGGYLLRLDVEIAVDAEGFEAEVDRAREAHDRGDFDMAAASARDALQRWAEPFPEDAYAEWARTHRDRLERLHQEALEIAAAASIATGHSREAVDLAVEAVGAQPMREAAHALLIQALAADGDQAAAVSAYHDLRRMLSDELGLDPSAETTTLYQDLLRGDLPAPGVPGPRRVPAELPPLVGRRSEVEQLVSLGPDRRIAVVSGRSGWGKSRLLAELTARSARPVLLARALLPEREDPWSLVRTLVQAAPAQAMDARRLLGGTSFAALRDVVPELDPDSDIGAPAVDSQSRRALALHGLVSLVQATAPSLVVVDDLQWADSTSLDALALLASRDADVTMVFAYRPEEVDDDSPVSRFLRVIAETRPVQLPLRQLDETAMVDLVGDRSVAAALERHTDGTPFAVLQVIRTLQHEGLAWQEDDRWHFTHGPALDRIQEIAHAGQRDAVWRQFERQQAVARDLLAVLALFGRPVPVRLLSAAAAATPEDVMRVLRGLARAHLVRHDTEGVRIAHDLVGETIRDRLDPTVSAQLHQRIADVLTRDAGPVDELARHLTGAGDPAAAAVAYAASASERLSSFADREADQLASEGLALQPTKDVRAALLEVRAETRARRGDLDGARHDLREALSQTTAGRDRSRLLARLAGLTAGAEDMLRASELADLALAEAAGDRHGRARALHVRALIDMNLGHRVTGEALLDESLALFTELGDVAGTADILDARAMFVFGWGEIGAGVAEFARVDRLFTDSGNLFRVVTPRSTRGHGLLFMGHPQEGLEGTSSALDLARSLGYAEGEAMVLWHHAELLIGCDRPEEALAAADAGAALAHALGHRGWTTMTVCAQGLARQALGDLDGAVTAFEQSLSTAENLLWFGSWTHSRLARVLIEQGRFDAAAAHVRAASDLGPASLPLYEARLAACELAVRRSDGRAAALIDDALRLAVDGGHVVSAERLRELQTELGRV